MKTGYTLSFFGAILDCADCGYVLEIRANDIRDLIAGMKDADWAGLDCTDSEGREVTLFVCRSCSAKRQKNAPSVKLELVRGAAAMAV